MILGCLWGKPINSVDAMQTRSELVCGDEGGKLGRNLHDLFTLVMLLIQFK